ncbi:hypothetical protein EVAR_18921_1 [Eumeta japonica]|uniref:Uncharacterized protein n=1 Tax=Eumeta variegata TaxID=151549 RepID=A0A4C1V1T1_EUMVA|nr:hypothetical protein EVAR_18921_1 [Eumeta japonica]
MRFSVVPPLRHTYCPIIYSSPSPSDLEPSTLTCALKSANDRCHQQLCQPPKRRLNVFSDLHINVARGLKYAAQLRRIL